MAANPIAWSGGCRVEDDALDRRPAGEMADVLADGRVVRPLGEPTGDLRLHQTRRAGAAPSIR